MVDKNDENLVWERIRAAYAMMGTICAFVLVFRYVIAKLEKLKAKALSGFQQ